jgi:ferredoxin-NADP reductase
MDDRCLETKVTLLYCVRTIKDIIFEQELVELQSRLKHFRHHVLLSQPHPEWTRASGHINREFVKNAVEDLTKPDFLLCGPPPFMEASREILTGLGVDPKRIRQESFGSHPKSAAAPAAEGGVAIEFVRSGKSCSLRSGQTLLEAAEEHGVGIPSSCRQGLCGTCKTRLLGGNVSMDAEEGLDPDSRALGYVLTCVGRTDGPVRLDA